MVANPESGTVRDEKIGNRPGGAMNSILVAMDGSPPSMAALEQAVIWANLMGAELRGVFVEDEWRFVHYPTAASFEGGMSTPVPLPADKLEAENRQVKAEGDAIRDAFEKAVAGKVPHAAMTVVRGNVNDILVSEARAADLVVMGKRGRNDPPDSKKPGPTTESLIHDALRPVLVVPAGSRLQGGVLLAFDGSISANRVLVPGTLMASAAGHEVNVLTVEDNEEKARAIQAIVKKYFHPHGIEGVFQIVRGKPAREIISAANAYRCGLIVMGAFGHGPIRQLVFGSSTLNVLEDTPCPVLLMA